MSSAFADLIAKLNERKSTQAAPQESKSSVVAQSNVRLMFVGTAEDKAYLHRLKALVSTASVTVLLVGKISTLVEITAQAKARNVTGIISTHPDLLSKVLMEDKASLSNYAGSFFRRNEIEFVFIDPLPQLVSVPYGAFLAGRYISKLTVPAQWNKYPPFEYTKLTAELYDSAYRELSKANLIAVDIETTKLNLAIRSISYTAVYLDSSKEVRLKTFVFPLDSSFALAAMRNINALPIPKIFQNGKYDISYLLRYNAIPHSYFWDTATAHHCWYTELPKDLGSLQAFYLREGRYWKDMSASSDEEIKLEYNARDTYATAIAMLEWFLQAPQWARTNYLQEFPVNYPAVLCEGTGIKRDMEEMEVARAELDGELKAAQSSLNKCIGVAEFNVNSPIQMKSLFKILGCSDLESLDEKNLAKAAFRHPLISRICDMILEIRGLRKLKSTYLRTDADITKTSKGGAKELNGIILYSLNPHGTDTGRLASKEHHFWCGLQIQNISRGPSVKRTLVARNGFRLAEADLEQAESRDTAHIAGDESLIKAVSGTRDFHSVNASAFFGVPYVDIYSDELKKTINKALRDLAKRVNHGANYNMGPGVLVETMGLANIYKAGSQLNLPKFWTPNQIAEYLLGCFHKTYPALKQTYYTGVVAEIKTTKMLTSKATHNSQFNVAGWTRYCFSDPEKDKRALNAYVAHSPQSLNAMTLNKAFLDVFYNIALKYPNDFHLLAQIHDSILFEYRPGFEHLAEEVKQRMEVPVTVQGYDGKVRTFTVPAALKSGGCRWSELG